MAVLVRSLLLQELCYLWLWIVWLWARQLALVDRARKRSQAKGPWKLDPALCTHWVFRLLAFLFSLPPPMWAPSPIC